MADTFQFYCPACGTPLSLPVAASGQQGPCPRCSQEIVAPDLESGAPARRLAALKDAVPTANTAMAPPVVRRAAPPELPQNDLPWMEDFPAPERRVSLVGAILCCVVIGGGAFFAGHMVGKKSVKPAASITIQAAKDNAPSTTKAVPESENALKPDVTTAP
jgi:hypothetical protein